MGRRLLILFLFLLCSANALAGAARLAQIPDCPTLLAMAPGRTLEEIAIDLHGGDPLRPTPTSRLGRYLAETGAASRSERFLIGDRLGPEKLVIAVSPETFDRYNALFVNGYPNLIEQVNAPNFFLNPGMPAPEFGWHYWFRWLDQVYDYSWDPGFHSVPWRFPQDKLAPMILLSDSEVRAFHDYLDLVGDPYSPLRLPQSLAGFNYPTDAYVHQGNCTAFLFHAPIGDTRFGQATACGNLEPGALPRDRLARVATLTNYQVPVEFTHVADQLKRVWNPSLRTRLLELVNFPVEHGFHSGGSHVAEGLLTVTDSRRSPFAVYYTANHRVLDRPTIPVVETHDTGGRGYDLAIGADGVPWVFGTNDVERGKGIYRHLGDHWHFLPGMGGKRIAVDGKHQPLVISDRNEILEYVSENGIWLYHSQRANDVAHGGGKTWIITTDAGGGGYSIKYYNEQTGAWVLIPGGAVRIAVRPDGNPYVVNDGGFIYSWDGANWHQDWFATATDASISATDGRVWIVTRSPYPGGFQLAYWNGRGWTGIPLGGIAVAPAPDGSIWVTQDDTKILRVQLK